MGTSAAETLREIEQVRSRLDGRLRDLEQRLPDTVVWAKRAAGTVLGGGATGGVLWFAARRMRSRRSGAGESGRSRRPLRAVVEILPDGSVTGSTADRGGGSPLPWLLAGAAAGAVALRLLTRDGDRAG